MGDVIAVDDLGAPVLNDVQRMAIDYGESKRTVLTVDAVCDAAVRRTGLHDFGDGDFALRLDNRFRRTRALGAAAALEKLDTNRRANAAREVAAPRRLAENLALSNRAAGGRCVFVAAHRLGLDVPHGRPAGRGARWRSCLS